MVWDVDGKARLNYAESESGRPKIDLSKTLERWDDYRAKVIDHYDFDKQQVEATKKVYEDWERQLTWYFDNHKEKILEYFHGLQRRAKNREDAAREGVESLRGQRDKIEAELVSMRAPWLAQIDQLWIDYDKALNDIATEEQREARSPVRLGKPAVGFMDTNTIDRIVPYFDLVVGVLLILGLFTRLAALAGAGFLISIISTQWPLTPGAQPVYYQTIEVLGLLVLAAVAAGQFAGLDNVLYSIWSKFKKTNQETNS